MNLLLPVLGVVAAQRLAELAIAAVNTRRLKAAGAVEIDAGGYPFLVLLHAGWLAGLAVAIPADAPASWPLLAAFAGLQAGRIWVIATLRRRWTTRIVVPPEMPRISTGPYRLCRHPNYLIVAMEIAVLPLAFGAVALAVAFSAANWVLLARRIRIEDRALAPGLS